MNRLYKCLIFLQHLLPAIIWGAIIFLIISVPGSAIPKSRLFQIEHIDKIIHFIMFFGFSLLLSVGFFKQKILLNIRKHYFIYSVFLSILYGGITEIAQGVWFDTRSGNIWDFFANTIGAFIGALIFSFFIKNKLVLNIKTSD